MNESNTNPEHYKKHPSGVECIQVSQHFNFNLGNVIKYVWRADHKAGVEDLEKAKRYLEFEIEKRKSDDSKKQSGANLTIPQILYNDPKCRNCKHWERDSRLLPDEGNCRHVEQSLDITTGSYSCEHYEP